MTTLMEDVTVIGVVHTHKHTRYAAAIGEHGRCNPAPRRWVGVCRADSRT